MEFTLRRKFLAAILCLAVVAPPLLLVGPSSAAPRPLDCKTRTRPFLEPPETSPELRFRICTGTVKSKDGTSRLDVTVTLPATGKGPFPLIVMLHGLTGSKYSNESTFVQGEGGRRHYNNLWFAAQGYMVLTYTARGWDIPNDPENEWPPASISPCVDDRTDVQSIDDPDDDPYAGLSPACFIQIAHLKYEVVDTQYLAGRLVDGTLLDVSGVKAKRRIGVTGVSYGGGQTWLLTRKNEWKSPRGARVRVGAAAPLIGWTDLLDALAPNGRRSDDEGEQSLDDRRSEPIGVKNHYVDVFYDGVLARASNGGTVDYIREWRGEFNDGEPYESNEILQDAEHKLLTKRSAFFVPKTTDFDTPIMSVQGFTDGIFPAIQSIKMYNRLQEERAAASRPAYPMKLYLGDWGHPLSENDQEETDYIVRLVNDWFRFYLKGRGDKPVANVEARTNKCGPGMGELYRGPDWESLSAHEIESPISADPPTLQTQTDDPIAHKLVPSDRAQGDINEIEPDGQCRVTDNVSVEGNAYDQAEVLGNIPMLGMPTVNVTADPSAEEMYIAARLWDLDEKDTPADSSDDEQTLVSRGIYRLEGDGSQVVSFKLFGNAYTFLDGHKIKFELTADDSPSFDEWSNGDPGNIDLSNFNWKIPVADCAALVEGVCPP